MYVCTFKCDILKILVGNGKCYVMVKAFHSILSDEALDIPSAPAVSTRKAAKQVLSNDVLLNIWKPLVRSFCTHLSHVSRLPKKY